MSAATTYIPQVNANEPVLFRAILGWLAVCLGAWSIILMVTGAPVLETSGHTMAAGWIYFGFSRVCHQIAARSFYLDGNPLAVCARCFGLYLGFAGGATIYPIFRSLKQLETPARRWLFLSAVPILVDFSLGYFGIWANTHTSRFLTGALLGSVSAFFVIPGIVELAQFKFGRVAPAVDFVNSDDMDVSGEPVISSYKSLSDFGSPHARI